MVAVDDQLNASIRRAHEYCRTGQSKEAARCLVAAIKTYPASSALLKLLAEVQRSLGNWAAEVAVLEELSSLEPLNAETWGRLASIQLQRGRAEGSYRAYLRASRLAPGEIRYWEGLATAALSTQRFASAEEAKDQLLKRFPDSATSYLFAGHIHKALGNAAQARADYEKALVLNPRSSEAIYGRADLDPPALDDSFTLQLEELLQTGTVGGADSANLNFALARIFEAAKQYRKAFTHYEKANAAVIQVMEGKGISYKPGDAEERVARTLLTYPPSAVRRPLAPLPIQLRLIFIVGMPRSGTSVVEQILASHPKVAGGGELAIATDCELLYAQRRDELGLHGAVNPEDERERGLLTEVRERYIDQLFEHGLDADYVTDKLPANFTRLAFIRLLFPDAVIIHCKRHPIATCWSLFASNFASHDPYYNSLAHLAHYYRCYEGLMAHWRSILDPPIVEMRYEDLVSNPEMEIRRLIGKAGLDWDDRCMAFHDNQRPVLTASCAQVRSPIYATSVDRWRHYESALETLKELCP